VDNHKNVIIMGDSSGGTLALSLISKITDDASLSKPYLDKIKCSILYSPWIDLGCEGKSYYTRAFSEKMATGDFVFSEMPFKNIEEFRKVALTYLGKESLLKDNIANPINIKKSQLEKFPPTMIFIGDNETLLSDIVNFGKKSQLINKNVFINLYQEMWHVWPMYSQGCTDSGHLKQSYNAFKLTSNFINGYLVDDTYKFKEIDTTDVDYMDNVTVKIY
jgi:acetyl esterase/lipase